MNTPDISLVFETSNEQDHRHIRLAQNIEAWKRQTRAERVLEWILVSDRPIRPQEKRLLVGMPYRWIVHPGTTYYEQKNVGIAESRGQLVALADADDRPDLDWLEHAIDALEGTCSDVAAVTGRTRYEPGPFSIEMTVATFPFQREKPDEVLTIGAGNSLFRADVLRRLAFEGGHLRHGADEDLARRLAGEGRRILYDPRLRMTHNFTANPRELWGNIAMKGYNFAAYAGFRGEKRRGALHDAVGRYRVLLRRLADLRRPMGIRARRLPLCATFFLWYCVAAGTGWRRALKGKPEPGYRF